MGLIILTLLGLKYFARVGQISVAFPAVNNHGKTNEATKNVKEPLKTGQTQPTAEQKQDENKQKKSRGRKM